MHPPTASNCTFHQIEDQMLDPILTISVVDGDPSCAPDPYAFLHLNMTFLPRGMSREDWTYMEMIPGYVEPPPPPPPTVSTIHEHERYNPHRYHV